MTARAAPAPKLSHADVRRVARIRKAERIEDVLRLSLPELESKDLLDVGTGSGMIASYFRPRVQTLWSVDIVDERVDKDFQFELIDSEELPFGDASFDIVISNHVIEHVDDRLSHLKEISRVLKPGGLCYIATPNLIWPIEPHFDLPFLAWLPTPALRDFYVRAAKRGTRYDANLVTFTGLRALSRRAGLTYRDASLELATTILGSRAPWALPATRVVWPLARWAAPSLVALLRKDGREAMMGLDGPAVVGRLS